MRIVRAFRLPIIVAMTGLVLSGCMRTGGPVVQPQGDLDSMAYGQTNAPAPVAVADSSGGGAISALRSVFASSPRAAYALAPASAVSAAPVEAVRYDAAYHLDAGDRLRVVVYGQEGLTNTYAIDASGSITMPLIGIVPARGRTTAGLAGGIAALCAQHDGRERGRNRRRLLAAGAARQRHGHPYLRIGIGALRGAARHRDQPRRHGARRGALVLTLRHSGSRRRRELRCAIAHRRISRFGVRSCGPPRNDAFGVTSSSASRKTPGSAARRCRRRSCRSWPARRNGNRAARRDRRKSRCRAAGP